MERFATALSRGMVAIAGFSIVAMLVLVAGDVISRAVLNIAIPGIDTVVAAYLMVATIFLPLAMLEMLEENISVDILRDHVPDVVKDIFDVIGRLLTTILYGLLAWLYVHVALESFEIREFVTGTWDVPIWPARIIMPIGLLVATLAAGTKLLVSLRALIAGSKPPSHHTTGTF